jgi:hypothetical protein
MIVAAVALALCAAAALLHPPLFFRAYLVAFLLVLGASLGALVVLMISRLTGGGWAAYVRPGLEAAALVLPATPVFFLPLVLGLKYLYPWAADPRMFDDAGPLLQNKAMWLSVRFWLIRAAVYFAVWIGLALLVVRGVRRVGPNAASPDASSLRGLCGVGLGLYGITVTAAAIDWTMSLEPDWFSTIYGVILATGQMLSGMSVAVLVVVLPSLWDRRAETPPKMVCDDLGNLLLTFTLLWAYTSFSQYLLIYSGNLPEEIVWYIRRASGGWQWAALALILLQFAAPLLLLIGPAVKRQPRGLACIALLALFMRIIDLTWNVVPAYQVPYRPEPIAGDAAYGGLLTLTLPLAVLGLGGLWLFLFLQRLKHTPPPEVTLEQTQEAPAHA